ncbi:helix-turn-helix domain-containing protein [Actinokineospora terrae]|uniref:cAMP-binding domain of CRP or a regulatory subunit of cAMP-dependent protein kinases n=1 Tax=Actinokineospora terrae TaxID=155974 RepID=A0A1H9MBT8_9PSEU|nr:helix-turn-helix domain-containing protein [Actinokineospora terrae]SER20907.1 cAMP-binding domain of CRP or a regulatory subunit of cAMP-dependent protein kinases [Actinokineospora terrae]
MTSTPAVSRSQTTAHPTGGVPDHESRTPSPAHPDAPRAGAVRTDNHDSGFARAIGRVLRARREALDLSPSDLAARLGSVKASTIGSYERGDRHLTAYRAAHLCHALRISPEHLLTAAATGTTALRDPLPPLLLIDPEPLRGPDIPPALRRFATHSLAPAWIPAATVRHLAALDGRDDLEVLRHCHHARITPTPPRTPPPAPTTPRFHRLLGGWIRRLRALHGWSRQQLADRVTHHSGAAIAPVTVHTYETGTRHIALHRLHDIACALDASAAHALTHATDSHHPVRNRPPGTATPTTIPVPDPSPRTEDDLSTSDIARFPERTDWPEHTLLGALTTETRITLLDAGHTTTRPAGAVLMREGDTDTQAILILDGTVKITARSPIGTEVLLDLRSAGDIVGETGALTPDTPHPTTIRAATTLAARIMHSDTLATLLATHPDLSIQMSRSIQSRLRWAERRRLDTAIKDGSVRLATLLIELTDHHGELTDGHWSFPQLTRHDLGCLTGMAPRTVEQAIAALKPHGLTAGYRTLHVTSLDGLRRYARESLECH